MPADMKDPAVETLRAFLMQHAPAGSCQRESDPLCACVFCSLDTLERNGRDLAQLQVQLAACLIAAEGGTSDALRARRGEYGWSLAYQTVLDLRWRFDRLEATLGGRR